MPLGSSSAAPVTRPGPSSSNSAAVLKRRPSLVLWNGCRAMSVAQIGLALGEPGLLVGQGQAIQVAGAGGGIVDPFAQCGPAVDHVDRQLAELIFVGKVAPQRIVRLEPPDRLEGERLQPPRPEGVMIVDRSFGM